MNIPAIRLVERNAIQDRKSSDLLRVRINYLNLSQRSMAKEISKSQAWFSNDLLKEPAKTVAKLLAYEPDKLEKLAAMLEMSLTDLFLTVGLIGFQSDNKPELKPTLPFFASVSVFADAVIHHKAPRQEQSFELDLFPLAKLGKDRLNLVQLDLRTGITYRAPIFYESGIEQDLHQNDIMLVECKGENDQQTSRVSKNTIVIKRHTIHHLSRPGKTLEELEFISLEYRIPRKNTFLRHFGTEELIPKKDVLARGRELAEVKLVFSSLDQKVSFLDLE